MPDKPILPIGTRVTEALHKYPLGAYSLAGREGIVTGGMCSEFPIQVSHEGSHIYVYKLSELTVLEFGDK